ncbi:MAG: acyltransferase [Bacteriovorax sp.]
MNISKVKILFLFGNLLPFIQLLAFIGCLLKISGLSNQVLFSLIFVYLIPPFLFRVLHFFFKIEPGVHRISDRELLIWWYGAQLQLSFSRFPFLEELLRTIPFTYSIWLRLWGAKIGKFVYWSPRVEILDRNLIEIGDRVVVGFGVKMASHLINKEKIFIAPISIGADSVIGGEARIAPGCIVGENVVVKALSVLAPMTVLNNSERDNKKTSL